MWDSALDRTTHLMDTVYQHSHAVHTLAGAMAGFRYLSPYGPFHSLLDVGAGIGTWIHAAYLSGIPDVWGVDYVAPKPDNDFIKGCNFEVHDLSLPLNLNRTFDCVMCLEVAEHLKQRYAETLIASLCRHGSLCFFSAARPGQFGQNHINCQWPCYWQRLFNAQGFACVDDVRWRMWTDIEIEPWYRQNVFRAVRDPSLAGSEPRIPSVVHPDMLGQNLYGTGETGSLLSRLPLMAPIRSLVRRATRHLR